MSLVKHFEIRCDVCGDRLPASFEIVANTHGITKGNGAADVRKEAKESGWLKTKSRYGFPIDLCPVCRHNTVPLRIWFEENQ